MFIRSRIKVKHQPSNSQLFKKRYKKLSKIRKSPRVPAKYKGENPRHHSDLFTDEEKSRTIHGLKFRNAKEAKSSVEKIKKLYKSGKVSFAHAKQAGLAMEQRSRFHAHPTKDIRSANRVWSKFVKSFKKK